MVSRTRTKLSENDVSEMLNVKSIQAEDVHPSDPITRSRKTITLDQLRPYDHNPRQSRNPKFDSILASIETRGLDHPPNISRRHPDDNHYIIIDGGNTRLEILNILYDKYSRLAKETNEESQRLEYLLMAERFYRIDCVFRPWISESDTLAGHMSENEERGDILRQLKRDGVTSIRCPPRAPNCNAVAERFVRSVKEECLDRLILFGEHSLRRTIKEYMTHYHRERNHQGVGNQLLTPLDSVSTLDPIKSRERLGGMLKYYYRAAA